MQGTCSQGNHDSGHPGMQGQSGPNSSCPCITQLPTCLPLFSWTQSVQTILTCKARSTSAMLNIEMGTRKKGPHADRYVL